MAIFLYPVPDITFTDMTHQPTYLKEDYPITTKYFTFQPILYELIGIRQKVPRFK